jgi:hypothetical protein
MSFPRLATTADYFPRLAMSHFHHPGHSFGENKDNYATNSPTPATDNFATNSPTTQAPTPIENYATSSPTTPYPTTQTPSVPKNISNTTEADKESDYEYDETSVYSIFRDKLDELKIGWPLSQKEEDKIISKEKAKYPDKEDFDTLLIKMAFLKGDDVQKSIMIGIADKIDYTL